MSELYDHETEKAALGVIANTSATNITAALLLLEKSKLSKADFHLPSHAALFGAMDSVLRKGLPADPLTIKGELEASKAVVVDDTFWGYSAEILMGQVHLFDSGLPAYSEALRDLSTRRRLLEQLREKAVQIQDRSVAVAPIVSGLYEGLGKLAIESGRVKTLSEVSDKVAEQLDEVQSGRTKPVIATGFEALDDIIGGWQPTLTMLGALPGVGKSALIAAAVRSMALRGIKVGVFSLEDEATWLAWRVLSREAGINQFTLRYQQMNKYEFEKTADGFKVMNSYDKNVFIVDGSDEGLTIEDIVSDAHDMILNAGVQAILVDHIGEVAFKGNEARHDLEIARGLSRLRGIANRFSIPVIVAAHLKRRDGLEPGSEPKMSDFANSAGAERKARVALGLCRHSESDEMGICVLKNTWGKAGIRANVKFIGAAAMLKTVERQDA